MEKRPQEKTPQISPVEKTPQLILQPVEKIPHPFWGHVEKSPQFSKKASNNFVQVVSDFLVGVHNLFVPKQRDKYNFL